MQILHVSASAWMRDSAKCKIFKSPTLHKLLTVFFVNSVLIHNNNNNNLKIQVEKLDTLLHLFANNIPVVIVRE